MLFWDVNQHPGAYRVAGLYQQTGPQVTVKVFVSEFVLENGKLVEKDVGEAFSVEGDSARLEPLIAEILALAGRMKNDAKGRPHVALEQASSRVATRDL